MLTVIPNVFAYDRRPNALPKVDDLEGKVEREESLGINRLSDLTYKHIMDLYTCTECGRCSDNCPAYITGKKLSPKHLTLAIRDHLYATEKDMFGKEALVGRAERRPGEPIRSRALARSRFTRSRQAPEGALLRRRDRRRPRAEHPSPRRHLGMHLVSRL